MRSRNDANGGYGRSGAFRSAKRDDGIPVSQQPYDVQRVPMTEPDYAGGHVITNDNGTIFTREYYYDVGNNETIVIQDHSAGHETGGQGSHFNVRPASDTRNGVVDGTLPHYPYT